MQNKRRFWLTIMAGMLLLVLQHAPALAYAPREPKPTSETGLLRPRIQQKFDLYEGDSFEEVTMYLDGKQVPVQITPDGLVYYDPPHDLAPGRHQVRLRVVVHNPKPLQQVPPREFTWEFVVRPTPFGQPREPDEVELQVLNYINELRRKAGSPPVTYNSNLALAARAHAKYMAVTGEYGHEQKPGHPLFTGELPYQRAAFFGYTGKTVGEDAHKVHDPIQAVDDWMSGPYHRFLILDPSKREIGFGFEDGYAVLLTGSGPESRETDELVIWPYNGQNDVPFYWIVRETPDPLRLYPSAQRPTGYPISLQFGISYRVLSLTHASLKREDGTDVPFMTFTPENDNLLWREVFLIPYDPLEPGTTYHVSMAGLVRNPEFEPEPFAHQWSFTTYGKRQSEPMPPTQDRASPGQNGLTDIANHWAKDSIERLIGMGIVSGYPDGTFRPNDPLTRSAFVKLLVSALGLPLRPGDSGGFADTSSNWAAVQGYLGAAVQAGLLTPDDYADGLLNPETPITRMEITRMLVRAADLPVVPFAASPDGVAQVGGLTFIDGSQWPDPPVIAAAIRAGLIQGYPEDGGQYSFRPSGRATRAEACVLVLRLLDYLR